MMFTLLLMALVNTLLSVLLFSKTGGGGIVTIDLDSKETKTIYAVFGGVYALTALTLLSCITLL